ncbi:sulfotransferase 1B1-like [Choristoneura fumiferana]|uniref:sulfotransferase 1B1-like n=1 Tax=Choristoneura fumiferana TaxID=7141 RepID=UPI003D155C78
MSLSSVPILFRETLRLKRTMAEPVKVKELPAHTNDFLKGLFKGHSEGFCRFGDVGYLMPMSYKDHADTIRTMPLRNDDIWVATFPRCGTTWTQEMVWLLKNNLDYEGAKKALIERYIFIDYFSFVHEQLQDLDKIKDVNDKKAIGVFMQDGCEVAGRTPSPRFFKTHLPMSLLPETTLETTKMVYVARDPRDAAVSFYHLNRLLKFHDYAGDFKTHWKLFMEDLIAWTPFMDHLKEAWELRHHPNLLFIFYEDMIKDLPGVVRRVSTFLGKKYSDEEIKKLCAHLDFNTFKNNESTHPSWIKSSPFVNPTSESFVRKGNSGGWRDYFDEDMIREADVWMAQGLADTDMRFPDIKS